VIQTTAEILEREKEQFGKLITLEMGKPVKGAIAEVEKCAVVCRYYAEHAAEFLADVPVSTDASIALSATIGSDSGSDAWNFPFGRCSALLLCANGGECGLKHAPMCLSVLWQLRKLFNASGFPNGVFQTLLVGADKVAALIADERVAATLTGNDQLERVLAAAENKLKLS